MFKFRAPTLVVLLAVLVISAACSPLTPAPGGPTSAPSAPTAAPTTAGAPATQSATSPTAQSAATPASGATPTGPASAKGVVPTPAADGSKPLAKVPAAQRADMFGGPAPTSIKPNTPYQATIVTSKGDIVAELYPDAPQSVNNFVTLSEDGYYDGLTFHRVEPGFVIQGGDPMGTGTGGPGYTIPAEINHKHTKGALAWARTGDQVNPQRESSGSQFYITLADTPQLDGAYTVFGQVIQGMDVAEKIAVGDTIKEIKISEAKASQLPTAAPPTPTREPSAPKPAAGRPVASTPVDQRDHLYTMPPAMSIDTNKQYQATITTPKGKVVLDLDAKAAPNAVNNFVVLSNLGFYDGMPVAFVRPEFAVLGSPKSTEASDAGYWLKPETPISTTKVLTGTISMYPVADQATQQWSADGSQFLIWQVAAPAGMQVPLSVFGKVASGMDVVTKLQTGDKVDKIEITEK